MTRRTFWCVQRPAGLVPVADAQGTLVPGDRLCRVTEKQGKADDPWIVETVDRGPFPRSVDSEDRDNRRGGARRRP